MNSRVVISLTDIGAIEKSERHIIIDPNSAYLGKCLARRIEGQGKNLYRRITIRRRASIKPHDPRNQKAALQNKILSDTAKRKSVQPIVPTDNST